MIQDVRRPADRGGTASESIVGRVLRADGRPAPGARIMIAGSSPQHRDIAQVTGEGGDYGFHRLAPGRYTIAAFTGDRARGEASVEVAAGAQARLDIPLEDVP